MKEVAFSVLVLLLAAGAHGAELGEACNADADCTDSYCDLLAATKKCALKVDIDCTGKTDKCGDGAECKTDTTKCACKTGYSQTSTDICAGNKKIGGTCTSSEAGKRGDCLDANSICPSGKKCECKSGYTGTTGKTDCTVIKNKQGGSCTGGPKKPGTCTANALCSAADNGKCECTEHYNAEPGHDCTEITAGTFGGKCKTNDVCTDDNTKCVKTYCVCNDGYTGTKAGGCKENSASGLIVSVTALMLTVIAGRMTWA